MTTEEYLSTIDALAVQPFPGTTYIDASGGGGPVGGADAEGADEVVVDSADVFHSTVIVEAVRLWLCS
ncbi:hypothetical protein [Streptomyces mirabilis]